MTQAKLGPIPRIALVVGCVAGLDPSSHLRRKVRELERVQGVCGGTPELCIYNHLCHHVDLLPGEALTSALSCTRHVLVQVHHYGGHMMRSQVQPRQSAKRSHRGRMDPHDLRRESTGRLRLPVLEHRVNGAAVVLKCPKPVACTIAQVTRAVERDPSEPRIRRFGPCFEISQTRLRKRRTPVQGGVLRAEQT